MSKERLEDIKDRYMELEYDFNLRKEDIDWLIKQAERVEELEETIVNYQKINKQLHEKRSKYKKQMKRYKQALEQITQLGWSDDFGGGHNYMGEYHAQAIKISEKALDGDLDE